MGVLRLPDCVTPMLLALALLLHGGANALETPELQGRWELIAIDGRPVRTVEPIFFEIDGVAIRGFDGCNSFGGRLDAPSKLRMTQRGCPPSTQMLPLNLADPMPQLKAATLIDGRLLMQLPGGPGQAEFKRR